MTSKTKRPRKSRAKKAKASAAVLEPRPAAEGVAVSFTIHDQERTLEAVKGDGGWAITPADEEEARALAGISDEALTPPAASAAEESAQAPEGGEGAAPASEDHGSDENAGEPGQEDQA
jgi:hypothetical protein